MLEILPVDDHIFSLETTARCLWNLVNFDFDSNSVVFIVFKLYHDLCDERKSLSFFWMNERNHVFIGRVITICI